MSVPQQQLPPGQQQYPYPAAGQPTFAMQQITPGAVAYYPQSQPGAPQMVVGAQVVHTRPPNYEYTPSSFKTTAILTILFCGLFSPLSLIFSIPALLFANKSQNSAKLGAIKAARSQGMVAAYLSCTAVVFALILATILTGLVVGLYSGTYYLNQCLEKAERDGEFPDFDQISATSRSYYNSPRFYC